MLHASACPLRLKIDADGLQMLKRLSEHRLRHTICDELVPALVDVQDGHGDPGRVSDRG
jgi:hypothetical protein